MSPAPGAVKSPVDENETHVTLPAFRSARHELAQDFGIDVEKTFDHQSYCGLSLIASIRPQRSAVCALIRRPDKIMSKVRCRPIRLATDTHPPAPGIRPMESSGS